MVNKDVFIQIRNLKERGMEFMSVPDTYYQQLREKLKHSKVKIAEDLSILEVRQYLERWNDSEFRELNKHVFVTHLS